MTKRKTEVCVGCGDHFLTFKNMITVWTVPLMVIAISQKAIALNVMVAGLSNSVVKNPDLANFAI